MDKNRKAAYLTLVDVETKTAYSNIALNNKISLVKPSSPAFVREMVYGVLERQMTLDYFIDKLVKDGIKSLKAPELVLLRMGIYQLSYMDSVPAYAAVNECVTLAKKYCEGKDGLVNGVLREYQKQCDSIELPKEEEDLVKHLSIKYSYEPWIIELWLDHYTRDFVKALLAAGNQTPPLTLRLNWLKVVKDDLMKALAERGYEAEECQLCKNGIKVKGSAVLESDLYKLGLFTPQDESSMLVAEKLDPQHGDLIMDVCAAPGGKTTAIAERMNNTGRIIASDIYKRKLEQIESESKRLGLRNIEVRSWDATRVDSSMVGKADRVLVDAPCSGLGVIRRKPEIKYKKKTDEMDLLPKKQLAILSASAQYVKAGGTLVYSTCTVNPAENEAVVAEFLKKNSMFSKVERMLLLPNINDTDGFFICVMKKADILK